MDFSLVSIPNGLIEQANITKITLKLFPSLLCMTQHRAVFYYYVGSHCSYYSCKKSLQIQVVQSVLSNLAESKVNKLTCKPR